MAKTMSTSQRIGITGENFVKYWAGKHSSSAQKMEDDFGFDFTFQVYENGKFSGKTFVAQCKTVEKGDVKYLKLEKDDLFLHLSSNSSVCLLGVDLEHEKVRFLFLDESLVDRYCKSIKADHQSLCINFDDLLDDSLFEMECKKHCILANRQKIFLYTAQKMLDLYAPGVTVSSILGKNVDVLNIKGQFLTDLLKPSFLFNYNKKKSLKDILNPEILEILKKYYPDFKDLMISGIYGLPSAFSFGQKNVKVVAYRKTSTFCYRMKSGFVLSGNPKVGDEHQLMFEVDDSPYNLVSCDDDCSFFEEYNNSTLFVNGSPFIEKIQEKWIELDSFFVIAKKAVFIAKKNVIDFSNFYLKNLYDQSTCFVLHFLYSIFCENNVVLPFVMGVDESEYNKLNYSDKIKGVLPIEFSFGNRKYLLTCDCNYKKVIYESEIHGVVIEDICNPVIKEIGASEKFVQEPYMFIAKDWPPLPINIDVDNGTRIEWSNLENKSQYLIS